MQRIVLAAFAAAAVCQAMPAKAAATPEQARALETQFKAWMAGMLGPNVRLGDRPVQFTPDGEAYRVSVPIPVTKDGKPDTVVISAQARPVDGGRWAISAFRLPLPARFTVMMPQPAAEGQKTPGAPIPVTYNISAGSQDGSGTWDTTYATPSTFNTTLSDLRSETSGPGLKQSTTLARSASNTTVRPAGGDRVDVVGDAKLEGYALSSTAGDTPPITLSIARAQATTAFTGMSRDRATQTVQAVAQMIGTSMAKPAGTGAAGAPPPVNLVALRTMLQAMDGLASEFKAEQTWDNVAMSVGGVGGKASQVNIGMVARSPDGILQAAMDFGLDGLALPDLQLGPMADFVPRRIAFRPVVSGVASKDLLDLARAATETKDGNPPPEAIAKLFSRGGVNTGLESFMVDLAGTVFSGNAKIMVPSPDAVSGAGQLTATNFDALVTKAQSIPQFASVLPALPFFKGLARNDGSKLVWDIAYQGGKLLVNGTDLSAMMGGGAK